MEEIWKELPDWPNHWVSNLGNFKGPKGLRKLGQNKDGYPEVKASYKGKEKKFRVHRLVCETFHGPPPFEGAQALHKDHVRTNCREDNLYWGSAQQNMDDRALAGNSTGPKGAANPNSKLDVEKVQEIRLKYSQGITAYSLAKEYGVVISTINAVVQNLTWKV